MAFLFPKAATPQPPPPTPTINDAAERVRDRERGVGRRGRAADILTSEQGLPNLGSVGTRALMGSRG